MKKYTYNGPSSGVTLADGREVLLWDGKIYDLPDAHPYVQSLVDQRRLTEVKPDPKPSIKKEKP